MLVVLAHIGCYLPADYAKIRLIDQLFTRMGSGSDSSVDLECSTFQAEMREAAIICRAANNRCLVLLDELGRATAEEDGIALAWAISEELLFRPSCYTMLATHYAALTQLSQHYANVQNLHLSVEMRGGRMFYRYKLMDGSYLETDGIKNYGLYTAECAEIPMEIVNNAAEIAKVLQQRKSAKETTTSHQTAKTDKELYGLMRSILSLREPLTTSASHQIRDSLTEISQQFQNKIQQLSAEQDDGIDKNAENNVAETSTPASNNIEQANNNNNNNNNNSHSTKAYVTVSTTSTSAQSASRPTISSASFTRRVSASLPVVVQQTTNTIIPAKRTAQQMMQVRTSTANYEHEKKQQIGTDTIEQYNDINAID